MSVPEVSVVMPTDLRRVATSDRLNYGNALAQGVVKVFNGAAARQLRRQLLNDQPNSLWRAYALYRGTF